jgi:hypothetical protein
MRWAGHVARIGEKRMHIWYWWESQKERDHWEYQDVCGFPTNNLYASINSPTRATRPAHLILHDLIILIILGEEYKLWSSSLCSYQKWLLMVILPASDSRGKLLLIVVAILQFQVTIATNYRVLIYWMYVRYVVGHKQGSRLLFQCIVPILWVLIIFWYGYTKCGMLKAETG